MFVLKIVTYKSTPKFVSTVEGIDMAVSLNHDAMTSFWLCKWLSTPISEPSSVGISVWGCYYLTPMDSISMCSNTCICQIWMREAVVEVAASLNYNIMTSFRLHKWPSTPISSEPSSVGTTVLGCYLMPMDSISRVKVLKYFHMSNMDVGSSGWGGCQPQPWH